MDPVTIDLPDVGTWGPYGWLTAYVLATGFLCLFSCRHILLSGKTTGDAQVSYIASGILSGVLGLIVFIATLCSANKMFNRSIELANSQVETRVLGEKYQADPLACSAANGCSCGLCSTKAVIVNSRQ